MTAAVRILALLPLLSATSCRLAEFQGPTPHGPPDGSLQWLVSPPARSTQAAVVSNSGQDSSLPRVEKTSAVGDVVTGTLLSIWRDYMSFYSVPNLLTIGGALGVSAILANTQTDREIQEWYRDNLQSEGSIRVAEVVETFGDGGLMLPIYAGATVVGAVFDVGSPGTAVSDWGYRSLRAVLVGAPPLLFLQRAIGTSRPNETNDSSWTPFQDSNGVSGHAFMGAVPFLTAASMTESWYLRTPLVLASFLPAWARFNNDDHFFSQVLMGWVLGYVAVESVNETERVRGQFVTHPLILQGGRGVGVGFSVSF